MRGWRGAFLVAGPIGGLLCATIFDLAWGQPSEGPAPPICREWARLAVAEMKENYDKALRACERARDEMKPRLDAALTESQKLKSDLDVALAEIEKLKQQPPPPRPDAALAETQQLKSDLKAALAEIEKLKQPPPPPPGPAVDPGILPAIAGVWKRLRPTSEVDSDPAKALAVIDGDLKSLLDERDALSTALTALQDKFEKLQVDFDLLKKKGEKERIAALDKVMQRPCALLSRTETADGGYRIEGFIPGGARAKSMLERDLERAAAGASLEIRVEAIDGEVCIVRLDDEWVLARAGQDASGPLEVDVGVGVAKLLALLPSDVQACGRAFAALQAATSLRDQLPGPDDDVELWANSGGQLMLCQRTRPPAPRPWHMSGGFRLGPGKAALLVVGKARSADVPPEKRSPWR